MQNLLNEGAHLELFQLQLHAAIYYNASQNLDRIYRDYTIQCLTCERKLSDVLKSP